MFYRKWIMTQARMNIYLLPMVCCIKWAAGDTKGQDASFTNLRPGFLLRRRRAAVGGLPGRLSWQSEGRSSPSPSLLPPTTLIPAAWLLASSAETLIFLPTFCQDHTHYPVHTGSLSLLLLLTAFLPCGKLRPMIGAALGPLLLGAGVTGIGGNKAYKEKTTRACVG